jgi:SAM-dependent methyltransferase
MRSQADLLDEYRLVEDPMYEAERESRYYTFRRVVRSLGPGNGRTLLDVGAYCGYFLDVAREGGYAAEGMELSKWAADRARSLGFVVYGETLEARVASGARYDVVTMWDVLEHTAAPRAELESAFQLLAPGGSLYLSTVDIGSLAARVMGRRWPWLMDMHLHYFDRSTIARLLGEVGFVDVTIGTYTYFVSFAYLSKKLEAITGSLAPAVRGVFRIVPGAWRLPIRLGDTMFVRALRPAV